MLEYLLALLREADSLAGDYCWSMQIWTIMLCAR